ncbi:unnamed protein product [Paramecium octaurelia]|uniref:Transmembrane protein n=1 Tax=Paramecium octaurelia TaxID=43137 RepID=A0A8S1YJL1_PAROT|nr:unnamed protein product [Paramecium octaurelia]
MLTQYAKNQFYFRIKLLCKYYSKAHYQKIHLNKAQSHFAIILNREQTKIKIQEQAQTKYCQNSFNCQQYNPIEFGTYFILVNQIKLAYIAERNQQPLQNLLTLEFYQYDVEKHPMNFTYQFPLLFQSLGLLQILKDFNNKQIHIKNIEVAKIVVKILLKLSIRLQQSYKITLKIKSHEYLNFTFHVFAQFKEQNKETSGKIQQWYQCYNLNELRQKISKKISLYIILLKFSTQINLFFFSCYYIQIIIKLKILYIRCYRQQLLCLKINLEIFRIIYINKSFSVSITKELQLEIKETPHMVIAPIIKALLDDEAKLDIYFDDSDIIFGSYRVIDSLGLRIDQLFELTKS